MAEITNSTLLKYKEVSKDLLHLNFPSLSLEEIEIAMDWSIQKRFNDTNVTVDNNYKNETINTTLLELSDYIISREPIITSYGVMFNKHGAVPNPIYNMVDKFINERGKLKKEMFKYPKGSELFERYNLLQNLAKIDANGFYGACGMFSCIYYNLYVASSVTTVGRSCNSAAALMFESFLNNNVPFGTLNELVTFIRDVINENRKFNDKDIIDRDITIEECFYKLMSSCGFGWIINEKDMNIVWEMLCNVSQTDLNRLFYKNNLFYFTDNKNVQQAIISMLCKLEKPYLDPNSVPEEIKDELPVFYDLLFEYVYYDKQIIDRLEKMESLIRSVSIIQDTDSAIVSFDGWYRYQLDKIIGIPMTIKEVNTNPVTGDTEEVRIKVEEFDFLQDDIIETERLVTPNTIIPQDGLRYSIINLLVHCIGDMVNDYMYKYAINSHSNQEGRGCFLILKNEFLFSRVLTTAAKKNYASIQEMQEGHMIPKSQDDSLDVKGLAAFVKSTMNQTTQQKLKDILFEDILMADNISQVKLIKDIAKVEREIFNSIQDGEKIYHKPVRIKSINSYDMPMRIQGIKASVVYNALHDSNTETINLEIRNTVDIVKVDITKKNVDRIKEEYPEVHEKMINLMNTKEFADGIESIAIPPNEQIPKWILPFIDYKNIINDNVSLFPLESIGLYRGNKSNNWTNIIQF